MHNIVFTLALLYGGGYLLNVERDTTLAAGNLRVFRVHNVRYRVGAEIAEMFFEPAHRIDRMIRRALWESVEVTPVKQ